MGRVKDHFHDQIVAMQDDDGPDEGDDMEFRTQHDLDDQLIRAVAASALNAKRRFADANISRLRIDIEIIGGSDDLSLSCRFKVGEHYDPNNAESNRLSEAVTEYMRRVGWREKNAALLITDESVIPDMPEPTDKPVPGIDKPNEVF